MGIISFPAYNTPQFDHIFLIAEYINPIAEYLNGTWRVHSTEPRVDSPGPTSLPSAELRISFEMHLLAASQHIELVAQPYMRCGNWP